MGFLGTMIPELLEPEVCHILVQHSQGGKASCFCNVPEADIIPASKDLKYGSPPHVGDAIELIIKAWNSISVASIEACWKHAGCLPPQMLAMPSTSQNVAEEAEEHTVRQMRNVLSANSGAVTSNGFLQSISPETLSEWIRFEEHTEIVVDDDDSDIDEDVPLKEISLSEKISEMKKVQLLLHDLHKRVLYWPTNNSSTHHKNSVFMLKENCHG